MTRPVTLFTGQWADLPLEELTQKAASWGFDGLELACWGDHFEVDKALEDDGYIQSRRDILERHGLACYAISNHLVGQAVSDALIDERHKGILHSRIWGDGDPRGVRRRAAEEMKNTARAARAFGVDVVNGFTGSTIWHKLYFFPPTTSAEINRGYQEFAADWWPILDVFGEENVKFALEVHPTEIAYDIVTSQRALKALDRHPNFGFNFDPSHLVHQLLDPVAFLEEFAKRIFHVHVKDVCVQCNNGRRSILSSHLDFGDPRRGWNFVSPGRGDVQWDPIMRALNQIGYDGPLSIEWEDATMHREQGAQEALHFTRQKDIAPSGTAFDAAFSSKE